MDGMGMHVVRPRAAGIDVHKMEVTATVRLCQDAGEPRVETRVFGALPSGLQEMSGWLREHAVEAAVLEGTGAHWMAPFEALEGAGIRPILVHAQQVKQLKGRKTDVADSAWLAGVCQFGPCMPSRAPPAPFRELRALRRQHRVLVGQRATVRNRVQKIVDRAGVRASGILSGLFGLFGRRILNGLTAGAEPGAILGSLTRHVAGKLARLGEALSLRLNESDRFLLTGLLREYDAIQARIATNDTEIEERMKPWEESIRLLTSIPGVDRDSAAAILIELGARHRSVRLHGATGLVGRLAPRQRRERRQAPQRTHPQGVPHPARHARRVRARRGANPRMPVPRPAPDARRPARLQARHRRDRPPVAARHLRGAQEPDAVLRPDRRLRGVDGQAQRAAVDPHVAPVRLHRAHRGRAPGDLTGNAEHKPSTRGDFGPYRESPPFVSATPTPSAVNAVADAREGPSSIRREVPRQTKHPHLSTTRSIVYGITTRISEAWYGNYNRLRDG